MVRVRAVEVAMSDVDHMMRQERNRDAIWDAYCHWLERTNEPTAAAILTLTQRLDEEEIGRGLADIRMALDGLPV